MRIRPGFVSNSSSTSFVAVCFLAPSDLEDRLRYLAGEDLDSEMWKIERSLGIDFDTDDYGDRYGDERPRLIGVSVFKEFEYDVESKAIESVLDVVERVANLAEHLGIETGIDVVAGYLE